MKNINFVIIIPSYMFIRESPFCSQVELQPRGLRRAAGQGDDNMTECMYQCLLSECSAY